MGDFERIFGAGADIDAIISSFGREEDYDPADIEPMQQGGSDLPQARTSFDIFSEVWRPAPTIYSRVTDQELVEIDIAAKETLAAIAADPQVDRMDLLLGDTKGPVDAFLSHLRRGLARVGSSLDRFETFIGMVVRGSEIEVVFARDSGPDAGHVSPTLSTHILAFPCDTQILRRAGLELEGPLRNLDRVGGDYFPESNSYEAFALTEPGREVLEISLALRSPEEGIVDATDWVRRIQESWGDTEGNDSPYPGFKAVARYVAAQEPRSRTWSDTAEDELKLRVGRIVSCLIYPGETVEVEMTPTPSGSTLRCRVTQDNTVTGRKDSFDALSWFSTQELIDNLLSLLPLAGFRGKSPTFKLLEVTSLSSQERLRGAGYLLDFLNEVGADTSAAAEAIMAGDRSRLHQIISGEDTADEIPF